MTVTVIAGYRDAGYNFVTVTSYKTVTSMAVTADGDSNYIRSMTVTAMAATTVTSTVTSTTANNSASWIIGGDQRARKPPRNEYPPQTTNRVSSVGKPPVRHLPAGARDPLDELIAAHVPVLSISRQPRHC